MGKNDICNHGTLMNSTNWEQYFAAQKNQESFLETKYVANNPKGKTKTKVLKPNKITPQRREK